MSDFDWREFMGRWSKELLESPLADFVPQEMRTRGYLGFEGAAASDVATAEARLKIALPPSYVAFLRISNGWGPTGQAINEIWRVQDIGWFGKRNRDWVQAYIDAGDTGEGMDNSEYYGYGPSAASVFKVSHLKCCLQITPVGDAAVYLLNPQAISADGEWEAWFMANWLPGAYRYRSFRELMIAQYHSFAGAEWKQEEGLIGGLPQEYIGVPGSARRKAVAAKKKTGTATDDLLTAIGRPDLAMKLFRVRGGSAEFSSNEEKAMRRLYRELAKRKEDRVAKALREQLQVDESWDMREEIIDALGKLRDRDSIELLFDRMANGESAGETVIAMHALKHIAPARLAETLLEELRNPDRLGFPGICMVLTELRELRAIPLLKAIVIGSAATAAERLGESLAPYAAQGLAGFGAEGCSALLELCQSPDASVRRCAAPSLYYCDDNRVEAALQRLLDDPDAAVRSGVLSVIECLRPSQRAKAKK